MLKKIISIIFCCIVCLGITGCGKGKVANFSITKEEILEKIISENNYIIVDVRTKEEYDNGHVIDAINIPYDKIDKNTLLDKEKTIIVYCENGKRSDLAYNTLIELGYEVFNLGAYDSIVLEKE